jgi:hypothetical protein
VEWKDAEANDSTFCIFTAHLKIVDAYSVYLFKGRKWPNENLKYAQLYLRILHVKIYFKNRRKNTPWSQYEAIQNLTNFNGSPPPPPPPEWDEDILWHSHECGWPPFCNIGGERKNKSREGDNEMKERGRVLVRMRGKEFGKEKEKWREKKESKRKLAKKEAKK